MFSIMAVMCYGLFFPRSGSGGKFCDSINVINTFCSRKNRTKAGDKSDIRSPPVLTFKVVASRLESLTSQYPPMGALKPEEVFQPPAIGGAGGRIRIRRIR
jgi:hypothetical protein